MRNPDCDLCSFGIGSPKRPVSVCLFPHKIGHRKVMVVGENPSREDDVNNDVFVSPGYRDVKKWLTEHGVNAYYTYAVKCRKPAKDAKITPVHIKACSLNYLHEEIKRVAPEHIIVLGAAALKAVTKKTGIQALQGTRFFDKNVNAWIYPTYHPAQVLYDRAKRAPFVAELSLYIRWIQGGDEAVRFEPKLEIVTSVDQMADVRDRLIEARINASDTETEGLIPYVPGKHIRSVQFCRDPKEGGIFIPLNLGDGCYYTDPKNVAPPFWSPKELVQIVRLLREIYAKTRNIWHNGKFDRLWLHMWGQREFGEPILAPNVLCDTLHQAFVLNENRPNLKLKKLIVTDLGLPSFDIPDKLTKDLDLLIPYAAKDTVALLLLARHYSEIMCRPDNAKVRRLYERLLRPADMVYQRAELRGWPLCEDTAQEILETLKTRWTAVTNEMNDWLESEGHPRMEPGLFSSPQQVATLLFETLGLPMSSDKTLSHTETGQVGTSELALLHLKHHPFVEKVFERRKIMKSSSTYVERMLSASRGRGVLTTSYKLARAVTGRTASGKEGDKTSKKGSATKAFEGMNLQNLPKEHDDPYHIKTIIKAPPGYLIWSCDYSQIELVFAGFMSRDPLLLNTYRTGQDLHTIRAARIKGVTLEEFLLLPKNEQKKFRTDAKPVNFGYLYGMSWRKFMQYAEQTYGIKFTPEEAQFIRSGFFEDHYGLPKWYDKQERMALKYGYVESPFGRRRRLPNMQLDPEASQDNKRLYQDARRQAINSPVQGGASDLKLAAVIEIDEALEDMYGSDWDTHPIWQIGDVHDAVCGVCQEDALDVVIEMVPRIMKAPRRLKTFEVNFDLPINVELSAGPSYGEMREIGKF